MNPVTNRRTATHWILAANETAGRLLRIDADPTDHVKISVEDEIRRSASDDGRLTRFAMETSVWIERKAEDLDIDRISVFASAAVLAALRPAWSSRFAIRVREHVSDEAMSADSVSAQSDAIRSIVHDERI